MQTEPQESTDTRVDVTPYRVLHVLDHSMPLISGYSVRSRSLIAAQAGLGLRPMALTGPRHEADQRDSVDSMFDGIEYRRTKTAGRGLYSQMARGSLPVLRELGIIGAFEKRISEVLKSEKFDLVHAHSPALCGEAALRACRKAGLPLVYEIRAFWEDAAVDAGKIKVGSTKYVATRALETRVVRGANAIVGIATHILRDLAERGIDQRKLFHVSNGVDARRFAPRERDQRLASELKLGNRHSFAFFGSLYRYEGISWLIKAVAELRKHSQDFHLLIIGNGEEAELIRESIRSLDCKDFVTQLGRVPFDEISRYYSVVDTVLLPRLRNRLTELVTPLKPLEAMAQEKLVLGSSVGGIRELVQHERTGLLFEPGDIGSFVTQALRAIQDRDLYQRLTRQGRSEVLANYDWNVLAGKYREVYRFALGV